MKNLNLAPYIDHTLLSPQASRSQIQELCREALEHQFAAVCVSSAYVAECVQQLKNSAVKVATVVGFSSGSQLSAAKAYEASLAVGAGALEVDMVLANWALASGEAQHVLEDILAVKRSVKEVNENAIVKVIIETSLLNLDQKKLAIQIVNDSGVEFIKTSTGFHGGGATLEDIVLMRKLSGPHLSIKASGGIRDAQFALELIAAGATRLGTSSGVKLVTSGVTDSKAY